MNDQHTYEHYSMILEWDPGDRIFVVTVPELPGCRTHGATYEEAVRQGQDAIESWVDAARADGDSVPPPRTFAYWSPFNQNVEVDATQSTPA